MKYFINNLNSHYMHASSTNSPVSVNIPQLFHSKSLMEQSTNNSSINKSVINVDSRGNTILHLAAKLTPPDELARVRGGAALQMQYELQRFKKVEKHVSAQLREQRNYDGKTARMIFDEEHQKLKRKGEEWMKDVATVCSSMATLAINLLYAANALLLTINPIVHESWAYDILLHSHGLGRITAIASLLIFLNITKSLYTEDDFLYYLPKELFMGLTTLFLSIVSTAVFYIMHGYLYHLGQDIGSLLLMAVFLCAAMATYKFLNMPFLRLLFSSAFGPG